MTDRDALVERVADLVRFNHDPIAIANEAISLIRAETLEEAARVCDEHAARYEADIPDGESNDGLAETVAASLRGRAAAIRALKGIEQ
jgi:hypothetical protein